ncbi:ABC transporter permease [Nitrospirillum sp. BR 11164]|uniref:ABC transporter permease n=1 Tax=Nitrospirillum sp. BR 11164 TaxID=3104324 RepID=UPI002B00076D|nr:ABC transporter permease [Nitrospirillum sp. BR 11164]MEA1647847.1 ABC transporter permease [Nitrospirillum sp. BR 11164]
MPMFAFSRILRRQALSTLLNLLGLAVGIAAFLLVSLYVAEEGTVDRGFTHADRLYRVGSQLNVGGQSIKLTFAPDDVAGSLKQEVPEVEAITRIEQDRVMLGTATRYFEQRVLWADPDFLRLLDYPLERGDPAQALARPDGVVVTRDLARTLFGDADPMGRTIEVRHGPALTVTGILAPLGQSHLVFTAIAAEAARGRSPGRMQNRGPGPTSRVSPPTSAWRRGRRRRPWARRCRRSSTGTTRPIPTRRAAAWTTWSACGWTPCPTSICGSRRWAPSPGATSAPCRSWAASPC